MAMNRSLCAVVFSLSVCALFSARGEESAQPVAKASLTVYPQFMAGDFFARNWMKTVPHGAPLSTTRPNEITKEPEYKGKPLYGALRFGDAETAPGTSIAVDDEANKIYIDANQDGDLTNDPKVGWDTIVKPEGEKPGSYQGSFTVSAAWQSGTGKYGVKLYRQKGSERVNFQTISAPTGSVTIDGMSYVVYLYDQLGTGHYEVKPGAKSGGCIVFIDTDGDGLWRPIEHRESVALGEAMQFGAKWYKFDSSADGRELKVYPAEAPPQRESRPAIKQGDTAPDFSMAAPDGSTSKLSDRKGKVLLVDFWATWCGPCIAAMPKVQALHEKVKDQPNVEFIGLCVMDEKDSYDKWMAKTKYTFTLVRDLPAKDEGTLAAQAYGITAIPTTMVISPEGKVVIAVSGFSPENEAKVVDALKQLGVKLP